MDLFKLLGAGATFTSKKRKRESQSENLAAREDVKLEVPSGLQTPPSEQITSTVPKVAPELDFFSSDTAQTDDKALKSSKQDELKRAQDLKNTMDNKIRSQQLSLYTPENLIDHYTPFSDKKSMVDFRKLHKIKVSPQTNDTPPPIQSFMELGPRFGAKPYLIKNLVHDRFDKPTPIQMQSIPVILDGKDLIACAPTGTGKTVSYLAPLLVSLKNPSKSNKEYRGIRSVIVSPTRELALQVERELQRLIKGKPFKVMVLSHKNAVGPKGSLVPEPNSSGKSGFRMVDIIISTPQKLVHEIQNGTVDLSSCSHLVLDEADRLLDMGFLEQVDEIIAACSNPALQRILFSATIPSGIETLAKSFMNDPIRVTIGLQNSATDLVDQKLLFVGQEQGKLLAVRQLLQSGGMKPPVLVFVETINKARYLFHELVYEGINVDVMHGERTKKQRDQMVQGFREGKIWVLICTELLARGIDFKGVNLVINYDFPPSVQSYIHRIGRTGRAGRKGEAITFFTKEDIPNIKKVVNVMKNSGCEIPSWLNKEKDAKDTKN